MRGVSKEDCSQDLPKEERNIFRNLVKCYDEKRYKKAYKFSELILKKFPNHGETLSMKGLISWHLSDKREEAFLLSKKGLRLNIKSCTCWRVLALLHRNVRDYNESMRCFVQAARLEPENITLARDLAVLQIHEGHLESFLDTRRRLFFVWPGAKPHWTSLAFAQHVNGNYEMACRLLSTALKSLRESEQTDTQKVEFSELVLYYSSILEESGDYQAALDLLNDNLTDKTGQLESQGRLNILLNHLDKAHNIYKQLMESSPSEKSYMLCFAATHPSLKKKVQLPSRRSPQKETAEKAANSAESINANSTPKKTDQEGSGVLEDRAEADSSKENEKDEPLLRLSLYALKAPYLTSALSSGWPATPEHIVFPNSSTGVGSPDLLFKKLRDVTSEKEEVEIEKVFDKINEVGISFILNFLISKNKIKFYLDKLWRPRIIKGATSIIDLIKNLFMNSNQNKRAIFHELLHAYLDHLKNERSLSDFQCTPDPTEKTDTTDSKKNSPAIRAACMTTVKAALVSLLVLEGRCEEALSLVNEVLCDVPCFAELHQLRSRVLRRLGRRVESAAAICAGRELDLADRFLNTETVKVLLSINEVEKASELSLYFSSTNNLTEMQSLAFEYRKGKAFLRLGKQAEAMAQFYLILDQLKDIQGDLYDFHWFCQRKGTFRSYIATLRMSAKIMACKYGSRAAKSLVDVLLKRSREDAPVLQTPKDLLSPSTEQPKNQQVPEKVQFSELEKFRAEMEDRFKLKGKAALDEAEVIAYKLWIASRVDPQSSQVFYTVASAQRKRVLVMSCLNVLFQLSNSDALSPLIAPSLSHFLYKGYSVTSEALESNAEAKTACDLATDELLKKIFAEIPEINDFADKQRILKIYQNLLFEKTQKSPNPENLLSLVQAIMVHHKDAQSVGIASPVCCASEDETFHRQIALKTKPLLREHFINDDLKRETQNCKILSI